MIMSEGLMSFLIKFCLRRFETQRDCEARCKRPTPSITTVATPPQVNIYILDTRVKIGREDQFYDMKQHKLPYSLPAAVRTRMQDSELVSAMWQQRDSILLRCREEPVPHKWLWRLRTPQHLQHGGRMREEMRRIPRNG